MGSSDTVTLDGRFMSAMPSAGIAPGDVVGPTQRPRDGAFSDMAPARSGSSAWRDFASADGTPAHNAAQPPPPTRGHWPGERGNTAREECVRYISRASGSPRHEPGAMAAQLDLSQVVPQRSLIFPVDRR